MKTDLENLLTHLVGENFTTEQGGEVEGPVGFYAILDLTDDESVAHVYEENASMGSYDTLAEIDTLVRGWWTYREDNQGFCYVEKCSEDDAKAWFLLNAQYDTEADDPQQV